MLDFYYNQFDNFCEAYNLGFIDSLAAAKANLSNNSFIHFDLNLLSDHLAIFSQLISGANKENCWFDGCLNCNDSQDQTQALIDCISKSSSSESIIIHQAVNVISKLAKDIKFAIGNPHDYILVQFRVLYNSLNNSPTENQDWHTDGLYSDFAQRTIITFKGNPTDFYYLASEKRVEYNDLYSIYNSGQNYSALQDFITPELISKARVNQGTIFTNLADNAAVHATPKTGGEPGSTRITLIVDVASQEVMASHNNKLAEEGGNSQPHFINQTPAC